MKRFEMKEIREAMAFAKGGGQALHLHTLTRGHRLFKRYPVIAHLFDSDKERLIATARRLGVRKIKVEREGGYGQHIDLCGKPFDRACTEAKENRGGYLSPETQISFGGCWEDGFLLPSSITKQLP